MAKLDNVTLLWVIEGKLFSFHKFLNKIKELRGSEAIFWIKDSDNYFRVFLYPGLKPEAPFRNLVVDFDKQKKKISQVKLFSQNYQ